jgi:polyhydroxyalkanoate synthase subunit PhaC
MSQAASSNLDSEQMQAWLARIARGASSLREVAGVEVGSANKHEIYREDKLRLYRYEADPTTPRTQRVRTPILICYALVNRPYMMDLQPDRSLIRGLLARGMDVYLIDWGYPDGADRYLAMKDYVLRYLPHCTAQVCASAGTKQVNLLGVCQGGTLSLCYAAAEPKCVRNIVTMVTPVDFRTPENLLSKWTDGVDIDALVAAVGNVPGEMLNAIFLGLMPFRLLSQKYVAMFDQEPDRAELENFLRMEKWIFDSPDQAGEMFRQFMNELVKENRLVKGTLEIGERRINLKKITMPVLNIYAQRDHLVPPASSRALKGLLGTRDYEEYEFQGGHIGIYVSAAAQREVPERIASWLRTRE